MIKESKILLYLDFIISRREIFMKISEIFDLGVSQIQLDFVDIDIENDYPLYIDPYLISQYNDLWSARVDRTIKNFFSKVSECIRKQEYDKAIELFQFMSEPKETCLGVSSKGTKNGKGVGEDNASKIIEEIIESKAIENNIVNNIEDIIVFVDDIDKDKLSDMTTNIIRKHLIDYTKLQCNIWGIPLRRGKSSPYWNPNIEAWDKSSEDLLFYEDRYLLLVPKGIVSSINLLNAQKYDWHFVVTRERDEHLRRRSSLVKYKKYKNGKERYYLPKKDVYDYIGDKVKCGEYNSRKDFLRQYTIKNPELFLDFKNEFGKKISSLSNEEFMEYTGYIDIKVLIDTLIANLNNINTGKSHALKYHKFIKSILEILFYPSLIRPTIEKNVHQGRKRVEVTMSNVSLKGFFHNLQTINKIPCPIVYIECRNTNEEVTNPDLNQLSDRLNLNKGKFGILMCRKIEEKKLFYKRCSNIFKEDQDFILPLDDGDIISMLEFIKYDEENKIEEKLEDIKKQIISNG